MPHIFQLNVAHCGDSNTGFKFEFSQNRSKLTTQH